MATDKCEDGYCSRKVKEFNSSAKKNLRIHKKESPPSG